MEFKVSVHKINRVACTRRRSRRRNQNHGTKTYLLWLN